ncbi:MAG TPA: c-type cytochrome biogenesis protein CcsB [Candidatus Binataceae bacterium]|jgi:cytochrome c-type biogenesis protein CcsB|nr:c-type cytochrome biogenesis protein CcsB [Candidatus Binataceae bacterium]
MVTGLFIAAIVVYAGASVGFLVARSRAAEWITRVGVDLLLIGAGLQMIGFVSRAIASGNMPVTNFWQTVSFLAWVTAVASLVLILRFRMAIIGAFVAPLVTLASAAAAIAAPRPRLSIPPSLRSAWLPVHVTLACGGFAMFVLAATVSLAYLICERRLKAKRPLEASADRTPSLEKLDRVNYRLLLWGFVMLSLAIVTGAIWADAAWGHFWSWEPPETWSLIIWMMYAALLESRLTAGWRGRRIAALTIVGFTVLVGSFVGVSLIAPGKHGGSFG